MPQEPRLLTRAHKIIMQKQKLKIIIFLLILTLMSVIFIYYKNLHAREVLIEVQENDFYLCMLNNLNNLTCKDKSNKFTNYSNVIKFKMSPLNLCIMTKIDIKCLGKNSLSIVGGFEDFELSNNVVCTKKGNYKCVDFHENNNFYDKIEKIDMEKLILITGGFCYQKDFQLKCTTQITRSRYYYQEFFKNIIHTSDGAIFCNRDEFNIQCKMEGEPNDFIDFSFNSRIEKVVSFFDFGCVLLDNGSLICWDLNGSFNLKRKFFDYNFRYKWNKEDNNFYVHHLLSKSVKNITNVESKMCLVYNDNEYECLGF